MVRFVCYVAVATMLAVAWSFIGRGLGVGERDVAWIGGCLFGLVGGLHIASAGEGE